MTPTTADHSSEEAYLLNLSGALQNDILRLLQAHPLGQPDSPAGAPKIVLHALTELAGRLMHTAITADAAMEAYCVLLNEQQRLFITTTRARPQ